MKTSILTSLVLGVIATLAFAFSPAEPTPTPSEHLPGILPLQLGNLDLSITATYCNDGSVSLRAGASNVASKGSLIDAYNHPTDVDSPAKISFRWLIDGVKPIDGPNTPCICGKYAILMAHNQSTGDFGFTFVFLPSC